MWIAANRDPAAFTDPGQVIVDRGTDDNLLFGAGIHRCLGERLAILNLRVAVEELLLRVARFELATPSEPPRNVYPGNGLRGLSLRVQDTVPA